MFYETKQLSIRKAKGFAQQIEEKTKAVVTVNHTDPDFAYVFVSKLKAEEFNLCAKIEDFAAMNTSGLELERNLSQCW